MYTGYMDYEVVFDSRRLVAPHVWEFCLRPIHHFDYLPGQYVHVLLPGRGSAPGEYRTMSLTSHPSESKLRFITRIETVHSSYKAQLLQLTSGDSLFISQAMGDAILPRLATTSLIFVAQGIALASYTALLTECERSDLAHPIALIWSRRGEDNPLDILIPGENKRVKRFDYIAPDRVTSDAIYTQLAPDALVYLSGSQTFVETLGSQLETRGVSRSRIIYDYYEGYSSL